MLKLIYYLQTYKGLKFVAKHGKQKAVSLLSLKFTMPIEICERALLSCDVWRLYD